MIIFNSLEFTRTQYVKLNIPIVGVKIYDSHGNEMDHETHEALSYGEIGYSLFFKAESIPPLGYQSYSIKPITNATSSYLKTQKTQILSLKNEYLEISYDGDSGNLNSLTNLINSVSIDLNQTMFYYTPSDDILQTSGAYIFRPQANQSPTNLTIDRYHVIDGPLVKELKIVYNESSITQIIRLYVGLDDIMGNYVDVEIHLGPLNVSYPKEQGKEVCKLFLF